MPKDTAQYISQLNLSLPDGQVDTVSTLDDAIRDYKTAVKNTFPRLDKPVNFSSDELNALRDRITFTAGRLNFNNSSLLGVASIDDNTAVQPRSYNDARYLAKANNLSDLPNKAAAYSTLVNQASATEIRVLANQVGNMLMPVGTIYGNAARADNPANYLGFGQWEPYAQGRVLAGAGAANDGRDAVTLNLGQAGGEFRHVMSQEEMPYHQHGLNTFLSSALGGGSSGPRDAISVDTGQWHGHSYNGQKVTDFAGSGQPFNVMQPYITAALWKRVA